MIRLLVTAAIASAAVLPARAFADEATPARPEKLTDAQLDEVTGGMGPPAFVLAAGHGPPWARGNTPQTTNIGTQVNFLIKDVTLTFNVGAGADVNFATALQLALLSQQPQAASGTAVQTGH